ncbi:Rib/alpha-like domain-containing protein, partial [Staphylococcus canis]
MKNNQKSKKGRIDFLPNRANKYSIRRFTVGTASILIGATLIFGAGQDARAAEDTTSSTETSTTNSNETSSTTPSTEEATTEQVTQEAPSTEEATTEQATQETPSTEEATTEQATQEAPSTEEATTEQATQETPSTEEATTEQATQETPSTEEATTEQATQEAPSTEEATTEQATQETPSTEEATTEQATQETPSTEEATTEQATQEAPSTEEATTEQPTTQQETSPQPSVDSTQPDTFTTNYDKLDTPESKATYTKDYLANNTSLSSDEIDAKIADLGLDFNTATSQDIYAALLQDFANQQDSLSPEATVALRSSALTDNDSISLFAATPVAADATTSTDQIIDADALANGYIASQTDATNAANTLSGRAWEVDKGTPATFANGLTPVPEGTPVYMQWIDKDGAVSPVYRAHTTNQLSSLDGSQVGPGAYAFDLREPWIDSNGNEHTYSAEGGQYYKLWIQDYQNDAGNTMSMFRQAGGFFPGSYVNSVTGSNLGQFPLIGTNMQRTGIYMYEHPSDGYMTKDQTQWVNDTEGPLSAPAVSLNARNSISGKVWLETGAGDYANSATGPNDNINDPQAAGYKVVFSSLTDEGAAVYEAQVNSLPESERDKAAKDLLTAHPEYISATVTGTTDDNGRYTVRFPDGTLNDRYLYGYVMDPNGNTVQTYSAFTTPEFRAPNSNLSWVPQTAPAQNLVQNPMWYNVNFAVVPQTELGLDVLDYNTTDNPATPDVTEVKVDLIGSTISPLPMKVEWTNGNGDVVKTVDVTDIPTAEQASTLVFADLPTPPKDGEVFTARLYEGGNVIDADSFIYKVTDASKYEPQANPVENNYGTPTTADQVTGAVTVPDYPTDQQPPTISVDDPTTLPDGNTPGTVDVPVTVTYPDGTQDHITVPVTTGNPDSTTYEPTTDPVNNDYGTPTTADQVTGAVTVPNYPTDQEQPTVTIDDPSTLPDGNTPGTVDVPVTITYPDGSQDHTTVTVTTGNPISDMYEPTTEPIEKDLGTPTTADEVTGAVTIPNYPTDQEQPTITIDDPSLIPDGSTPGTVDVPVTITYPDGSQDHTTVTVTTGNPISDMYEPTTDPVNNDYGTPTTEDQVIGAVKVPNYPANQEQPTVTIDDPSTLPDGNTPGTVEVPVTITYPDGSQDHTTVTVTTGEKAQVDLPAPTVDPIKDNDTTVTGHDGTPGNTIVITWPNGSTTETTVDQDGNWTVDVPNGTDLNEGDVITAIEKDKDGNVSGTTTVTVGGNDQGQVDLPAPTVDPIKDNDTTVTGHGGTPGNTIVITWPDGSTTETTVDQDGNWTVDVPNGTDLNEGDVITAIEKDKDGNVS